MKSRKSVKAILFSAVTLLVCMAMFVGSTFAWFTDSAKSKNQVIKSGNLDMIVTASASGEAGSFKPVEEVELFNDEALWEPGYVEVAYVNIVNNGTLAFEYSVEFNIISESGSTNVNGQEFKLSEYIRYSVIDTDTVFADRYAAIAAAEAVDGGSRLVEDSFFVDGNIDRAQNVLYPAGKGVSANNYAIVLFMPTSVGNEANYDAAYAAPSVEFGLKFAATQVDYEADDYNNQYDVNAVYPEVVTTAAQIQEAVAAGYSVVNVTADIDLGDVLEVPANGSLTINGSGQTIKAPAGGTRIVNVTGATEDVAINFNGVKLAAENEERGISFYNNAGALDVNIDNCEIDAAKYGINVAGQNANATLLVTDSTIEACWAAFNCWSGADVTFKNCDLIGVNTYADNAFATIVFDANAGTTSEGASLTLEGCNVYAMEVAQDAIQHHIRLPWECKDTITLNISEDTKFFYGTTANVNDCREVEADIAYWDKVENKMRDVNGNVLYNA